jgi:signal transduction histidine kinase
MHTKENQNFAYGPAHKPLVGDWIVPDRQSLFFFRYYWSHIRVAVILFILTLALIAVLGPVYTILIDFGYITWNYFASRNQSNLHLTRVVNFIRHLAPIMGVTFLMFIFGKKVELLWLLYFVPMLTVGVELDRHLAIGVIGIDALFVLATSVLFANPTVTPSATATIEGLFIYGCMKAVMVSYVGLTSYFLSRSLAYGQQLNKRLLNLLPSIVSTPYGWEAAARDIVGKVSNSFSDWRGQMIVNLLTVYGEQLYMTASSSDSGQSLVENGFNFHQKLGITGSVAKTGRTMFINDVTIDPQHLYYSQSAFPDIKAELAVPIKLHGQVVAVLDIESRRKNAFGNEDRQAMELVSAHLTEIYKQTHLLGKYQKLAQLSNELASKVIGIRDLGILLKEIGQVVMDVLDAQLIGYYFKDPQNGGIKGPYTSGQVLRPEFIGVNKKPNHLVEALFSENKIRIFNNAQSDSDLLGAPELLREEDPPFVIREGIISCAVVPLKVRAETIGLMFINYRRSEKFSQELLDMIEIVAPLAALAIQSSIQEETLAVTRKQRLLDELHDTVSHKLLATKISLENLEKAQPSSPEWKNHLASAAKYIQSANRIVYDICHGVEVYNLQFIALQSILDELDNDADLIRSVFGINVTVDALKVSKNYKLQMVSVEVQHLIDEALYNAARHSRADCIQVRIELDAPALSIFIIDNGIGFDEKTVKPGTGLYSMRSKIRHLLKGSMFLDTHPGQGTRIELQVPLIDIESKEN